MIVIPVGGGRTVGIRHITVTPDASIYEVVSMLDRHGRYTNDPVLASTCVISYLGTFIEQDADDVPIYTVH